MDISELMVCPAGGMNGVSGDGRGMMVAEVLRMLDRDVFIILDIGSKLRVGAAL